MRIAIVLPRNMRFGPDRATSIDLVVHDIVTHLPAGVSATVYTEQIDAPYTDVPMRMFPRRTGRDKRWFLKNIARVLRADAPDVVVVQQHLPSAVSVARGLRDIPVVLHAHAFPKIEKLFWRRWVQTWRYQHLAAIGFVSTACKDIYDTHWAARTGVPGFVIPNGIDLSGWSPRAVRDKTILCVGRMAPEKGILELAQALARVLPNAPDWTARFILAGMDVHPDYRGQVLAVLRPLGARVVLETQQPWGVIRAANEAAAIAVVPSTSPETFGKVALEAMAGGAALVSSIRGGLNDVVGDAAVRLDDVTPDTIAGALQNLMNNPEARAELGVFGRARAAQFTLSAQVAAFMAICGAAKTP
jgi:glycosyltransferase involved in cell wall biosynthesis